MSTPKTILLVEDNPDDELLAMRALRKCSATHQVQVARDGEEALRLLQEERVEPDLVLLDLKLPRVDGLEVLERVRQDTRLRHLPIVVLTTSSEESDIVSAFRLGANSYIRKPVNLDQFFAAIQQVCSYWFSLNELPSRP